MDRFIIELSTVINGPMGLLWIMACTYIIVGCCRMRANKYRHP